MFVGPQPFIDQSAEPTVMGSPAFGLFPQAQKAGEVGHRFAVLRQIAVEIDGRQSRRPVEPRGIIHAAFGAMADRIVIRVPFDQVVAVAIAILQVPV